MGLFHRGEYGVWASATGENTGCGPLPATASLPTCYCQQLPATAINILLLPATPCYCLLLLPLLLPLLLVLMYGQGAHHGYSMLLPLLLVLMFGQGAHNGPPWPGGGAPAVVWPLRPGGAAALGHVADHKRLLGGVGAQHVGHLRAGHTGMQG